MRGPRCYQAMSKLITVKSMVDIVLCLCVMCNYTKEKIIQCKIICSVRDYNFRSINVSSY